MADIQDNQAELESVRTIHAMSGVMRDIAATRTAELRNKYHQNVAFYTEVRDLYAVIRGIVQQQGSEKKPPKASWGIVATSSQHFYGGLNRDVVEYFIKHIDQYDDCLIIGKTGKQYIEQAGYADRCDFQSFKDDIPDTEGIQVLIQQMSKYDKVDIYYPAYKTPFFQEPKSFDINARPNEEGGGKTGLNEEYITEPELSKLYDFFRTHVKLMLFRRVLLETDLARSSARLMKMHSAEEASEDMIGDLTKQITKNKRNAENVELLETVVALKQWQKLQENK
ncbi:MAG: F0F1 ATP synthase subunit gamma [Candidatus Paceibacterota bacterium]